MWPDVTDETSVITVVTGSRRARGARWRATLLAGLCIVGTLVAIAVPASAAPIDDARGLVAEAQRSADAAAARYEEAIGRLEQLGIEIEDLKARIVVNRAEATRLRALARERAVEAYTGRDSLDGGGFVFDGGDPLDEIRREKLLARTKEREDTAAADLVAVTKELAQQQSELERIRTEQEHAVRQVEAEQATVQVQLRQAQEALSALEEQLRREQEAQRARELAAAAARSASNRTNDKDYSGTYVSTGIVCPIQGALSFIDSYGFPRHQGPHKGVDLMAVAGTPNVAVVSGNVQFKEGGTSGLGARLYGDDGTLYYYFHLSAYEGGERHVSQGEVIGYVGNTGDARYTAPHTHFEIHPGGGDAVNPYPSVAAVC
jgi:murein DD-endopeptidase MepM/ murein hydrolase activator NlpD